MRQILARSPRAFRLVTRLVTALGGRPPTCPAPITKEQIRDLVGRPDPTILEIGCNDGRHTQWFLDVFDAPEIYCFEPDPRAIARFRDNIGDAAGVHLAELALSDREGTVTFHQSGGQHATEPAAQLPDGWDQSGSIRAPKRHLDVHPWVTFEDTIEVETSTLDAWSAANEVHTVDFVWMDVQGAEIDVFRGGPNTLANTRLLYTEYSEEELYEGQRGIRDLLAMLEGFRVLTRYPGDVLLRNRSAGTAGRGPESGRAVTG